MAKAFRKYFHYVVILLLSAWGYHHAHAAEQTQTTPAVYFNNFCVGASLECNDMVIGHGHPGKAFKDRVKYITEENFTAVFKSAVQKQTQATTNYFTSPLVSLPHYLLRLPLLTIAYDLSVYIKSYLYIMLRVLRI
ncbi:MAG TPA: hypothetical protein VGN64_13355 [Dyadobacter sp.]|nr:hypothetical protein [Dyadobacter sp.]